MLLGENCKKCHKQNSICSLHVEKLDYIPYSYFISSYFNRQKHWKRHFHQFTMKELRIRRVTSQGSLADIW